MIFVNIACYRDPECLPTLRDLFHKARYPERINVGMVLQTHAADGIEIAMDRVRVARVDASRSQGACWARAIGYLLFQGEDFVLQIDSHMRFAPGWDVRLMAQLAACPSPRPMLTTYPPGYEPPDTLLTVRPAFLAAKNFNEQGILIQQGLMEPEPTAPKRSAFLAAGFLFGPSGWVRDVPYDPKLYFHGEETTLAARLWTHGWDLFGPTEAIIWHQYTQVTRSLHWSDHQAWSQMDAISMARVRQLLRMTPHPTDVPADLTGFDLGTARSFEQYQAMAGIDFRARTIAPRALAGDFG